MGQNPVSFFCPFPITISIVQIEKSVDCARDSNLQQQDGRRRRYRGTMAAAQTFVAKNFQEIAQSGHTGGGVDDFLSSSSLHLPNNLGSSESCFLLLLLNSFNPKCYEMIIPNDCSFPGFKPEYPNCSLAKKWAFPGRFSLFSSFQNSWQLIFNIIFADDWIGTADFWNRKRPLYQLSHQHCPKLQFLQVRHSHYCSVGKF